MVTKKARTEYMKRFREPKWETLCQCYEASVRYRLTRRVLEHAHRPWLWDGWDSGSGGSGGSGGSRGSGGSTSSGWSTPRISRNRITPLTLPPPPPASPPSPPATGSQPKESNPKSKPQPEEEQEEEETPGVTVNGGGDGVGVGVSDAVNPSVATETDAAPADSTSSSDGEPVNPEPRRRPRQRAPRSEPGRRDGYHDDQPPAAKTTVRKPKTRAKSQPPISSKNNQKTERQTDVRKSTHNISNMADVVVRRCESEQRPLTCGRVRSRSADVKEESERWVTEYMRCFSARLR